MTESAFKKISLSMTTFPPQHYTIVDKEGLPIYCQHLKIFANIARTATLCATLSVVKVWNINWGKYNRDLERRKQSWFYTQI